MKFNIFTLYEMHNAVFTEENVHSNIFHCVGPLLHFRSVFVHTMDHQQ